VGTHGTHERQQSGPPIDVSRAPDGCTSPGGHAGRREEQKRRPERSEEIRRLFHAFQDSTATGDAVDGRGRPRLGMRRCPVRTLLSTDALGSSTATADGTPLAALGNGWQTKGRDRRGAHYPWVASALLCRTAAILSPRSPGPGSHASEAHRESCDRRRSPGGDRAKVHSVTNGPQHSAQPLVRLTPRVGLGRHVQGRTAPRRARSARRP